MFTRHTAKVATTRLRQTLKMAQHRALALQDVLRELNPPPIDDTEVVSDSEPEREAARLARGPAKSSFTSNVPRLSDMNMSLVGRQDVETPTPRVATSSKSPAPPDVIVIEDEDEDVSGRMRSKLAKFKLPSVKHPKKQAVSRPLESLSGSRSHSPCNDAWQLTPAQLNKVRSFREKE